MITFLFFSIKRAWQGFWRNALMSLAATATMVLMLLLLAGFWIIQTGLLAGLEFTEQKVEVVAYLQPNATESQIDGLAAEIEARDDVESVEVVTRDKALERFRLRMDEQGRTDLTKQLQQRNKAFRAANYYLAKNTTLKEGEQVLAEWAATWRSTRQSVDSVLEGHLQ